MSVWGNGTILDDQLPGWSRHRGRIALTALSMEDAPGIGILGMPN